MNYIETFQMNPSSPGSYGGSDEAISGPTDCCNLCASNPVCGFAGYLPGAGCYYFSATTTTCAAGQVMSGYVDYDGGFGDNDSGYYVFNGACGLFNTASNN